MAYYGPLESHEGWLVVKSCLFVVVLVGLVASLWAILRMAKAVMLPRPKYVALDRGFTDYERGQNWSWDWCFVFPVRPDSTPAAYHKDARLESFTLRHVVERLALGGLETTLFRSHDRSCVFVKIRASAARLRAEAARTEYGLRLDEREVVSRIERGYRDGLGDYTWYPRRAGWTLPAAPDAPIDTAIEDARHQSRLPYEAHVFGRYDRRPDVQSAYATYLPSNSIFRGVDRLKLIKSIMEADAKNHGAQINVDELLSARALAAAFPLHADGELAALMDAWLTWDTWPWAQPLDEVKDYFGEKIGMYFHFLGHYTTWLLLAAAFGLCAYAVGAAGPGGRASTNLGYAICMSLWVTAFLESWKVAEATAAMRWGTTGFSAAEAARPQFQGVTIHSPVTGMPELYFPFRDRLRLRAASYAVVALCVFAVGSCFAGVFLLEALMSNRPVSTHLGERPVYALLGIDPGGALTDVAIAVVIFAACGAFMPLARDLNEYENHETDTEFENHLIAKVFVFYFVASYGPLFYTATIKGTVATWVNANLGRLRPRMCGCSGAECFAQIASLVTSQFLVRVTVGAWVEVGRPFLAFVKRRRGRYHDQAGGGEYHDPTDARRRRKRQVSPTEDQFLRDEYHPLLGTFEDYAEMVVQFGYATLFVTAFPLAPLIAAAYNFIEIRTDAFKLCANSRRPWPTSAADIGTWASVLDVMSHVAVATNALLITFTAPTFSNEKVVTRLVIFACYEYGLLGVKLLYVLVRDDLPPEVALQRARSDFLTRKIVDNEPDEPIESDAADGASRSAGALAALVVHTRDPEQRLGPKGFDANGAATSSPHDA